MLLLSCSVFLAAFFIPHGLTVVILMATFGYILSIDIGGLGTQILHMCCSGRRMLPPVIDRQQTPGFLWCWTIKEAVFHLCVVLVVGGVSGIMAYFNSSMPADLETYLGYAVMAVFVTQLFLSEVRIIQKKEIDYSTNFIKLY